MAEQTCEQAPRRDRRAEIDNRFQGEAPRCALVPETSAPLGHIEATDTAQEKAAEMGEPFGEWVWEPPARADSLAQVLKPSCCPPTASRSPAFRPGPPTPAAGQSTSIQELNRPVEPAAPPTSRHLVTPQLHAQPTLATEPRNDHHDQGREGSRPRPGRIRLD